MKILCFSDAHLLPTDPVAEDDKLADLLERALSDFDMVVIVGDLLEMYAAKGRQKAHFKRIVARYPRTFSALRHKNVKLVKGNHDDGGLAFLSCHIPVNKLTIDGYMFMHGHQADVMYSSGMMESVSEFIVKRVFWLESFFSRFTGFRITERFVEDQRKKRVGADSQRKYAEIFLRANPKLKGIVMGHTHIPLVEFYGRQVYMNTGAYIDGDAFLLDTTTGAVEIAWEDSNDA